MTNTISAMYELVGVKPKYINDKMKNLFKWFLDNFFSLKTKVENESNYFIISFCVTKLTGKEEFKYKQLIPVLNQALAGLVCELWEDLTPEQREEVRKVLE